MEKPIKTQDSAPAASAPAPEGWSINGLSLETGLDRRTVRKLLRDAPPAGQDAQGHPLYRLRDLITALRGANEVESDLDKMLKDLELSCPKAELDKILENLSRPTDAEFDKMLEDLSCSTNCRRPRGGADEEAD